MRSATRHWAPVSGYPGLPSYRTTVVPVRRPETRKFHPAGGGVPEEAVLGAEVAMQAELFEVLDQDAALGLDDGLGEAGRAGGVEHPQGVFERDLFEGRVHVGGGQGGPFQGALGRLGAKQRDVYDGAQGGQFAAEFGDDVAAIVFLAAVAVAVDG